MKSGDKLQVILETVLNQGNDLKPDTNKRVWEYHEINAEIKRLKRTKWAPANAELDGLCEILIKEGIVESYVLTGEVAGISINQHQFLRTAMTAYATGRYKS